MGDTNDNIKSIKIKILFFGYISESFGLRSIDAVLEKGTTINQLIKRFQLSDFIKTGSKISVNDIFCEDLDVIILDSSEVAILPPFSGG
jgi:molybdopterin converting factor small subunit|tara:strand:+ start:182 stop:448 length:267 start_codon:yes stop_codon:yes gene_type:complete